MSDLDGQDDPIFKGRTPGSITCAEFVRAVRKHAMTENKARDHEYIADYALSCLDGEALNWSETLSVEVQGDWTLLRRALLAEYNTTDDQGSLSSATIIPSALVPVPAAAAPLPTQHGVAIQNSTSSSAILSTTLTPVPSSQLPRPLFSLPSIFGGSLFGSSFLTAQTSNTVTRPGRIRVEVGFTTYYIIVSNISTAWCQLTGDIHKAAILDAVSTGENMEFKFTSLGQESTSYLGMVWGPKQVASGSYAGLLFLKMNGQKVIKPQGIPGVGWQGAVSVTTYTSSVNNDISPQLGTEKGIFIVNRPGNMIFITNDISAFLKTSPNWEEAKCVFEPL